MNTLVEVKNKASVPSVDGEMTSCYDECKECRCSDCFLLEWYGIGLDELCSEPSVNASYDSSIYN